MGLQFRSIDPGAHAPGFMPAPASQAFLWKAEKKFMFYRFVIELVVLTVLIVALVVSLILLRKRGVAAVAERATEET